MSLAAHLHLQLGDSPLQAQELLLQGGLLPLEGCYLLLDAAIFSLLEIKMSLPKLMKLIHFFLYPDQLVGEALLYVGRLHGEHRLEGVLLAPEDLHFLLVVIELIGDVFYLLLDQDTLTSRVCSLPFRDAGLFAKLCPVSL